MSYRGNRETGEKLSDTTENIASTDSRLIRNYRQLPM